MAVIAYEDRPLAWYVDRVLRDDPFALSRWGDGEWRCLLGYPGANTDQHPYSPELRADLMAVLMGRPTYELGLQELAARTMAEPITGWLGDRKLTPRWVAGGVFHRASIAGRLDPLIKALDARGVVLVGPQHLEGIKAFGIAQRVVVPDRHCHAAVDQIVDATRRALDRCRTSPVASISASMAANVVVDRVYQTHSQATLMDLGSLWEPYVGLSIRRYHAAVVERLRRTGR